MVMHQNPLPGVFKTPGIYSLLSGETGLGDKGRFGIKLGA